MFCNKNELSRCPSRRIISSPSGAGGRGVGVDVGVGEGVLVGFSKGPLVSCSPRIKPMIPSTTEVTKNIPETAMSIFCDFFTILSLFSSLQILPCQSRPWRNVLLKSRELIYPLYENHA